MSSNTPPPQDPGNDVGSAPMACNLAVQQLEIM